MFTSVLVANRGEIAVRICKTLRKMGIRAVVVASIPDRHSLAVRTADAWVLLEGYSAQESYLDIDAVIAAAKAEGCEAIHPGYGFLSERADFAERCEIEGIVFIGPPPAVLRGMGDKSAARRLAVENGVPVVPGWDGADDVESLTREAARIGYPVMLKARGGGGGRGMREVFDPDELSEAIESARREAQSAFGDPGLLVESLVTNAHHVEVQVLADRQGNIIHLGERDCSVQRRHQKLIEETPSPAVDDALRGELTGAALRLARAINYVNAGTFEFLVGEPAADGKRPFYFLEVNPRLQVEHPVTEMVTGLDLIELQLRIAAGEPLPLRQEDVKFEGHAIEFRINAEDPWDNFKPSSGRAEKLRFESHSRPNWRLDSGFGGFEGGHEIPPQYDSLLAKLIVHAPNRSGALADAFEALLYLCAEGFRSNIALHRAIVRQPDFATGKAGVDWLESNLASLLSAAGAAEPLWEAMTRVLAEAESPKPAEPFKSMGWIGAGNATIWLDDGARTRAIACRPNSVGCSVDLNDRAWTFSLDSDPRGMTVFRWNGGGAFSAFLGEHDQWEFRVVPPPPLPRRAHAVGAGATAVTAPLAGTIVAVPVAEGDLVEAGQVIALLEAMKMEHRITARSAGTVRSLAVRERDVVREGDVIAEVG